MENTWNLALGDGLIDIWLRRSCLAWPVELLTFVSSKFQGIPYYQCGVLPTYLLATEPKDLESTLSEWVLAFIRFACSLV